MKKFLAALLCAVMCLALAACGGNYAKETSGSEKPTGSSTEASSTTEQTTGSSTETSSTAEQTTGSSAKLSSKTKKLSGSSAKPGGKTKKPSSKVNSKKTSPKTVKLPGFSIKPSSKTKKPSSKPNSNKTTSPKTQKPASDETMTMEEFVESVQDQDDGTGDPSETDGVIFKLLARGNSLVYSCQFTEDVGDISLVKDSLNQSLEENTSTFEDVLSELKQIVPDAESVIVEYLDKDGNVITSREYK